MKKILSLLLIVIIISSLFGCSSQDYGVRKEIYNDTVKYVKMLDKSIKNDKALSTNEYLSYRVISNYKDLTENEVKLIEEIYSLMFIYDNYYYDILNKDKIITWEKLEIKLAEVKNVLKIK